jgi:hypothetical protein
LNGSIPVEIGNLIESFKISIDLLFKSVKIFLLILIVFRDGGEVKGKVSFFVGPLAFDSKIDRFFLLRKLGKPKGRK